MDRAYYILSLSLTCGVKLAFYTFIHLYIELRTVSHYIHNILSKTIIYGLEMDNIRHNIKPDVEVELIVKRDMTVINTLAIA